MKRLLSLLMFMLSFLDGRSFLERRLTIAPLFAWAHIHTNEYMKASGYAQGIVASQELLFPSQATTILSVRYVGSPSRLPVIVEQPIGNFTSFLSDFECFFGVGYMPIKTCQASAELFAGFGFERIIFQGIGPAFTPLGIEFISGTFKINIVFIIVGFKHHIFFGDKWAFESQLYIKPNIRPYIGIGGVGVVPLVLSYSYSLRNAYKIEYRCGDDMDTRFGIMPYLDYARIGATNLGVSDPNGKFLRTLNTTYRYIAGAALCYSIDW